MEEQTPTTGVTGAESGAGVVQTEGAPTSQDTGSTAASQDVNTGLSQQASTEQQQQPEDPFAGLPSDEEIETQIAQGIANAEALKRIKTAHNTVLPKLRDFERRFEPLEPFMDRLGDPEQIEQTLKFRESLWKLAPDPETGEVMPDTSEFIEGLSQNAPETADDMFNRLLFGQTVDYSTGQQVSRFNVTVAEMAKDPAWKNHIAKLIGVDPNQAAAPAWEPSQEEIERVNRIDPALLDTFKGLSFEERTELAASPSDLFVKNYLQTMKQAQAAEQQKAEAQRQQEVHQQQRQEVFRAEAMQAGNSYIDSEAKTAFSGFVDNLASKYQPTSDPTLNKKFALIAAATTLALSHNDTREPLLKAIQELQVLDERSISELDRARNEFAQNAFNYGNKSYVRSKQRERFQPQNGNGQQADPADLGILKSTASRALQGLIGQGNSVAASVYKVLTDALLAGAGAHNEELDQVEEPRRVVAGQPVGISMQPRNGNQGMTREQVWGPRV